MALNQFLDYGTAIFSIAVIVYIVKIFVRFISNHIHDNTKASQKLADSIDELLNFLRLNNRK